MFIRVTEPMEYDGREWPAGLNEVSAADAQAIFARGPARPATMDEIETAAAAPAVETAARNPVRRSKSAA